MLRLFRESLVFKAAVLFAAAALIPFVLASAFLFRSARSALYTEIVSGLDARVGLMRDTLDARLAALGGNALAWAGLDVMNDVLIDDLDKRISVVLEGLKRDYGLDGDIYALNADGLVVAASTASAVGRRVDAGMCAGALSGRTVVDDMHDSPLDGLPVVAFTVPIRARAIDGRTIGVLRLEYHVRNLAQTVLAGVVPLAAIVSTSGAIVASSSGWTGGVEQIPDERREQGDFVIAKAQQRRAYDFDGFGWTVIGAAEREQVLAPVTRVERFSIVAGLAGIGLLVGLVAMVAARTVRPLTVVANVADHIATTMNLTHKVPSAGEDEVGRVARAFNRMVDEVNDHVSKLLDANIEMLEVLGSAIAKRDSDTSAHNYRVTLIASHLAEARGLDRAALQALVKGSFLHDVGKIGVSDTILLKPGKLDASEYETMKSHVRHGMDIVGRYAWLRNAMDVVGHHHEKYDGTGYPARLAAEHIPLNARIFAIADVFDALTSARPYKAALPLDAALGIMKADRGSHFDPDLFDLFERLAPRLYTDICQAAPETLAAMLQQRMRDYFFMASATSTELSDQDPVARA